LGSERYIYFRTDGFVDAGSRFSNMPERVVLSAKNYLKAFEQGVRSSFVTETSDEEIQKIKQQEVTKRDEKAEEFIKEVTQVDTSLAPEEYVTKITETLATLEKEVKVQKREELKEANLPSAYKNLTDVEVLKKILKILQSSD
jgi:phytoene dehydrogenase-like protein